MLTNIPNLLVFSGTNFFYLAVSIIYFVHPAVIVHISSLPQNMLHEHQQKNSFNMNQNNIVGFQSREVESSFKFMFIGASTNIFLDGKSMRSITECSSWIPIVNFYFQSSKQLSSKETEDLLNIF